MQHMRAFPHAQVPESAGPLPTEPSTKLWLYKSMISPDHTNMGLLGPVLVTGTGRDTNDLDREFISLFQVDKRVLVL